MADNSTPTTSTGPKEGAAGPSAASSSSSSSLSTTAADNPPPTSGGGGDLTKEGGDDDDDEDGVVTEATANSLKCDDCGKLLRDVDAAQRHGEKTGHAHFSESTTAIQPLTEEEKQAQALRLQQRMAERREQRRQEELADQRERERIRRKAGQDMTAVYEKMKEKEMALIYEQRKREKQEDKAAKAKILAQIEQDRLDRAARQSGGGSSSSLASAAAPTPIRSTVAAAAAVSTAATAAESTMARIQVRGATPTPLTRPFGADEPLSAIYAWVHDERSKAAAAGATATGGGGEKGVLVTAFPRAVLTDQTKTLRELNLVPSAALLFEKPRG